MKKLGPLQEKDKSFIHDKNIIDYVNIFQDQIEIGEDGKSAYEPLTEYFQQSEKHLAELLFSLLQFNPSNRYSA